MTEEGLGKLISFQDQKFDISHLTKYFQSKRAEGDLTIYYELDKCEEICSRGILEICPFTNRVTRFFEKPQNGETKSRNASVVFYFLRHETQQYIKT
jgi:glucuronokinase